MKSESEIRAKIQQLEEKRDGARSEGWFQVARDHHVAIIYLRFALGELPEEYDP